MITSSLSRVVGVGLAVAAMVGGVVGRLEARAYSGPACDMAQNWLWMDNRQQKSPCLTAAYLQGACLGVEFTLPSLSDPNKYDPPGPNTNVTANSCSCSWAVYNLYSACSLCQGVQNGILTWASWSNNCAGFLSSTAPYPPNFPTADNTTFPNWAATNPTIWTDGRWNAIQAQNVSVNSPGDWVSGTNINPTSTPAPTPKSSNNVGAIAGGVVGGVLALAIGVAVALFVYCRSQRRQARKNHLSQAVMGQVPPDQHHIRSPSDLSAKTFGSGFAYTSLRHTASPSSGSIGGPLGSPTTFHTHNLSIGSMTHESLLALGSTVHPVTPPPNTYQTPQGTVSPFTLEHPSSSHEVSSSHDRKRSDSSTHAGDASGSSTAQGRSPMNPPAYSEAPHGHGDFSSQVPDQASTYGSASIVTTPNSTPQRRLHEKSPSVGSDRSGDSTTSASYWTHTPSASLSGVLSQMGSVSLPGPSATVPPGYAGPGPSTAAQWRDEKRRPTIMNPTTTNGENHEPPHQE